MHNERVWSIMTTSESYLWLIGFLSCWRCAVESDVPAVGFLVAAQQVKSRRVLIIVATNIIINTISGQSSIHTNQWTVWVCINVRCVVWVSHLDLLSEGGRGPAETNAIIIISERATYSADFILWPTADTHTHTHTHTHTDGLSEWGSFARTNCIYSLLLVWRSENQQMWGHGASCRRLKVSVCRMTDDDSLSWFNIYLFT